MPLPNLISLLFFLAMVVYFFLGVYVIRLKLRLCHSPALFLYLLNPLYLVTFFLHRQLGNVL